METKGHFMWIEKTLLQVDESYQRTAFLAVSEAKTDELKSKMAANWSWRLCGTLTVSDRGLNGMFVCDGGHRLSVAMKMQSIDLLPCMVFASSGSQDEASLFTTLCTNRRPIKPTELYKAEITAKNDAVTELDAMLSSLGLHVQRAGEKGASVIRCVNLCKEMWSIDRTALKNSLALCQKIMSGAQIEEVILRAVFFTSRRITKSHDFFSEFGKKLIDAGGPEIRKKIRIAAASLGVDARHAGVVGILSVINHGRRTKVKTDDACHLT